MSGTQRSILISTQLRQIAEQAIAHPDRVFTSLIHRMDFDFLREAFYELRRDGAPGLSGITVKDYEKDLDANLKDLHERLRTRAYVAPPIKRVWIDKDNGKKRPIGLTEIEDKIVQKAVSMLMGAVYEQDFLPISYGFREGRNAHDALAYLREQCMTHGIRWIYDADITGFFDNLDWGWLRTFIQTVTILQYIRSRPARMVLVCCRRPWSWTEDAFADDRVLRVQDGAMVKVYTVNELITAFGLTELPLAKDPHFGANRVFAGFMLEPLSSHVGLGDAPEVLLVCADGYRIDFVTSTLSQPQVRGLLAVRDTSLPAGGGIHWEPYQHGAETVSFDPFYLVWATTDDSGALDRETLPWPFQLTEIRRFDRDSYFTLARPPQGADDSLQKGFAIYTDHCGKCHRMRGAGGEVGPALDRDGSLSSLLTEAQLREYVRHDESRFPQSKMPKFAKILPPKAIDQVVAYLRAMQPLLANR